MDRPHDLGFLLDGPDTPFGWRHLDPTGFDRLELTSQIWEGAEWKHELWVQPEDETTCLLYITGDLVPDKDLNTFQRLVDMAKMPTAMLFGIPNQPLWDMREDDLIAHTFERWIVERDPNLPLLMPMARAVIRAMDALQAAYGYTAFILAGASKRGWTAWLAALTGDYRVVGVAPMVFDNLRFDAQMHAQIEQWGAFSPRLDDYSRRKLQDLLEDEAGLALARWVDPYFHLSRLSCPVLSINGANDEYWTVDALSRYWDKVSLPKATLMVPNAGHDLGDQVWAFRTLGVFARFCADGSTLPRLRAGFSNSILRCETEEPTLRLRVWMAQSDDLTFHDKKWSVVAEWHPGTQHPAPVVGQLQLAASKRNRAVMVEAEFEDPFGPYHLTSPVRLIRAAQG